jgi:hypothetical protein
MSVKIENNNNSKKNTAPVALLRAKNQPSGPETISTGGTVSPAIQQVVISHGAALQVFAVGT